MWVLPSWIINPFMNRWINELSWEWLCYCSQFASVSCMYLLTMRYSALPLDSYSPHQWEGPQPLDLEPIDLQNSEPNKPLSFINYWTSGILKVNRQWTKICAKPSFLENTRFFHLWLNQRTQPWDQVIWRQKAINIYLQFDSNKWRLISINSVTWDGGCWRSDMVPNCSE
jgi:hypothetical protein